MPASSNPDPRYRDAEMSRVPARRRLLQGASAAALALAAGALRAEEKEKDVAATEDLMREHGVLRRILLVYSAAAARLRGAGELPVKPLADATALFRSFGEQYHERALEEQHVFPVVRGVKGPAARYPAILKAQHDRGRLVLEYVSGVARAGGIASASRRALADALDAFVLMYRHHAAIEDTIVFPAWKDALSDKQYADLSDKFEDLERKMFGRDGYEDALEHIGAIESAMGLADLASFTAPLPPKA